MTARPIVLFARHYVEMVVVMLAGMFLLGGAALLPVVAAGMSLEELRAEAPALILLGMGLSMTVPMVWWMQRRGHSWAANRAMALAMILPAVALTVLLATGVEEDIGTLLGIEHTVMFPAMVAAMLPYRAEYTQGHERAVA